MDRILQETEVHDDMNIINIQLISVVNHSFNCAQLINLWIIIIHVFQLLLISHAQNQPNYRTKLKRPKLFNFIILKCKKE